MYARISSIIIVLAITCASGAAVATPPCEDQYKANHTNPPTRFELPVTQESICGIRSPDARTLKVFRLTEPPGPDEHSSGQRGYVLEHEEGAQSLWWAAGFPEDTWPEYSRTTVHEVRLEQVTDAPRSAGPPGCLALPEDEPDARYAFVLEAREGDRSLPVIADITFDADAGSRPPAPLLERVVSEPLRHACGDHSLFVAEFQESEPDGRFYAWSVHDKQGRLVQTGRGLAPHVLAFPDSDADGYTLHRRDLIGATQRPFEVGQTYEMRVRALDQDGRHSEESRAQFTFEATGESMYSGCFLVTIVFLVGAGGGALIVLFSLFKGLRRVVRKASDAE